MNIWSELILALAILGIIGIVVMWIIASKENKPAHTKRDSKKPRSLNKDGCLECGSKDLTVTAEAGLGQNVKCKTCGALYEHSPFGDRLLSEGGNYPYVVLPSGEKIYYSSDKEAFEKCAEWNLKERVRPGAYIIDADGVMCTDALYPYTGG